MPDQQIELAIRAARDDYIENHGTLSLVGSSRLDEVGLDPEYFERKFEREINLQEYK